MEGVYVREGPWWGEYAWGGGGRGYMGGGSWMMKSKIGSMKEKLERVERREK